MRQRLAEQGRAHVLERFSQERQVRETGEFYSRGAGTGAVFRAQPRGAAGGGELNEVANSKADSNAAARAVELPFASRDIEAKFRVSDTMLRWCLLGLEARLKALILTGSLARNEATWQQTDQGIHFLSDAEFIVIIKDKAEIPSPELVTLVCSGAEEELRNKGVLCKLSFGAVHESFLSSLGETIFGYELLTCGEVLYGDPDLLRKRSRYVTHVSEEDAWRMLANRTVELLEIVAESLEARRRCRKRRSTG